MMIPRSFVVLALTGALVAGCGNNASTKSSGSVVSGSERVNRCLTKQPDATKADCTGWERDGMLADDGSHKGHANM
ncbi:MAG: hypothetical protein H7247_15545 [Polaromonas sp.]|nr:hypothetical protein [Gemmatimonadaceae bacterium]